MENTEIVISPEITEVSLSVDSYAVEINPELTVIEISTEITEVNLDVETTTIEINPVIQEITLDIAAIGPRGKSNYEIAVDNGFVGTESQFLLTLKGDQGYPGQIQVERSFYSEAERDAYYISNPSELIDGIVICIIDTDVVLHGSNEVLTAADMNKLHLSMASIELTLPAASSNNVFVGDEITFKKQTSDSLSILSSAGDNIAGTDTFVNTGTDLYDFVRFVLEQKSGGVGTWGILDMRGPSWEGV